QPSPETAARIQAVRTRQTPFAEAATPRIPARRRPVRRVSWSVMGGAVAMAMIGWLSVSETHRSSVAVLPLTNATQDTALTYLTEGLSEGVTAALSRIPGLRVTTDTTDAVIAWTLRRQGDSLVLAVELRGTATSASQWAREFPLSASGALEIDSTIGFAQALVAEATASYHWRWAAAEPLYHRAIALDPTDAESHHLFGVYLRTLGRFGEAEAEMRRAVELEPLTRHFAYQLGRILACAGRPADAAVQFEKQLALDSVYPPAHYELAKVLASQGAYDAAIKELATGARQFGDTAYTRLVQGSRGSAGYT